MSLPILCNKCFTDLGTGFSCPNGCDQSSGHTNSSIELAATAKLFKESQQENAILKQVLGVIMDEMPAIYPKAVVGEYEKRTDYMDGWNKGVFHVMGMLDNVLSELGIEILDGDNCIDTPDVQIFN